VELFLRTPRGVQLLPAGQVLLPRARRVLADVAALEHGLRDGVDRHAASPSRRAKE